MPVFDHLALSAGSLALGAAQFEALTGVRLPMGGAHPAMGTHNRLSATGPDTFLELIATDPEAASPGRARWFGLDAVREDAALHCRALLYRTDDIEADIARARSAGVDLGRAVALTRGDLSWRFSVRDDGRIPAAGTAPMLLQWDSDTSHPARAMQDQGLRLRRTRISTPDPGLVADLFEAWEVPADRRPDIVGGEARLGATLALPDGREVTL